MVERKASKTQVPRKDHSFIERVREQHDNIYKVFLFLIATGLIVSMYPKSAEFAYDFEKGKPWTHEDLIAPFDFSIHKSEEAIEKEREEAKETVRPFYVHEEDIGIEQKRRFERSVVQDWKDSRYSRDTASFSLQEFLGKGPKQQDSLAREHHLQVGKEVLDSIFGRGVIKLLEQHGPADEDALINFQKEGVVEEIPADSLLNFRKAFDLAREELASHQDIDEEFLLDRIEEVLKYNVFHDEEKTDRALQERLDRVSRTRGKVEKDVLIVAKGDMVDQEKYRMLRSLKDEYEKQVGGKRSYWTILAGQSLLVVLCMMALLIFLVLFRRDVLEKNSKVFFLLFLMVFMTFITQKTVDIEGMSPYLVPVCILPIIIRAFYDVRSALFIHFITVFLISFLVPDRFEFAFVQIIAGFVVTFSIVDMRKRAQFFNSAGVVFLAYSASYVGLTLMRSGSVQEVELLGFGWLGGSAMLTLFAYPLIYIFEKLFGFLSEISLMELSDTNSPLLRELASQAPGTFQHSLQVADLCEEVVREIGGDTLLVRAGALYHDIGKMEEPMYFIENQTAGFNPHKDLDPEESAEIIIGHVTGGIAKAKQRGLPDTLIDFIRTHHGSTRVEIFYRNYIKQYGLEEEEVDDSSFRYPGPLPYSKETAVLMLSDSVEASSKSLKDYDADSIDGLVERIIDARVQEGQLINAPITLRDITSIKKILKRKLMNIYHVRIEYPQ